MDDLTRQTRETETAGFPAQLAREVRRPVVNDESGKRGTKRRSHPREEAGCQSGAARHDVQRLPACARTGCVCRWQCQHVALKMSRRKQSPRPNAIEETASRESQG